jgi:hypothetical protein
MMMMMMMMMIIIHFNGSAFVASKLLHSIIKKYKRGMVSWDRGVVGAAVKQGMLISYSLACLCGKNESNVTMDPEAAAPPAETAVAREATAETAVAPEVLGTETSDATEAGEIQEPASPTSEAEAAESATSPGEEKPDVSDS